MQLFGDPDVSSATTGKLSGQSRGRDLEAASNSDLRNDRGGCKSQTPAENAQTSTIVSNLLHDNIPPVEKGLRPELQDAMADLGVMSPGH